MSQVFTEADLEKKLQKLLEERPRPAHFNDLLEEMQDIFPGSSVDNRIRHELELPPLDLRSRS